MQKHEWDEIIQRCANDYRLLKSNGMGGDLVPRNFIRAWMQTNYDIFKLSGYFYRMFNAIVSNDTGLNESVGGAATKTSSSSIDKEGEDVIKDGLFSRTIADDWTTDFDSFFDGLLNFAEKMEPHLEKMCEGTAFHYRGMKNYSKTESYLFHKVHREWEHKHLLWSFDYDVEKRKKNGELMGLGHGHMTIHIQNDLNYPEKLRFQIDLTQPDAWGSYSNVCNITHIFRMETSSEPVVLFLTSDEIRNKNFGQPMSWNQIWDLKNFGTNKKGLISLYGILSLIFNSLPFISKEIQGKKFKEVVKTIRDCFNLAGLHFYKDM